MAAQKRGFQFPKAVSEFQVRKSYGEKYALGGVQPAQQRPQVLLPRPPQVQLPLPRPAGAYQVLEVKDNDPALNLEQSKTKLFAMFQRLHTHVEGTGTGLYMVKNSENAGGYIEVHSQLGVGSIFRVALPG